MRNVMTDYMLLLDADMIPPPGSHDALLKRFKATPELMKNERSLFVLPVFQRYNLGNESETSVTARDLPATKADLLDQMTQNHAQFDQFSPHWPPGQDPTNYSFWYEANELHRMEYSDFYEPYYMVRMNDIIPPFLEHFNGFGRNKVSWVEEMAEAGFQFYISPDMFLIHISHDMSKQDATIEHPFIY